MEKKNSSVPIFKFLSFVIAFVLPAYHSYKTVIFGDDNLQVNWIQYWMFFSIFQLFETICSDYIRHWYVLKCIILLVLQYQNAKYSKIIYQDLIRPILTKIEPYVDSFVKQSQQTIQTLQEQVKEQISKTIENPD